MGSPRKVIFDLYIKPRAAGYDHGKDLSFRVAEDAIYLCVLFR